MKIKKEIILSLFVILCCFRAEAGGYYKCTDSNGAVSFGPHTCQEGQAQDVIENETNYDKEESRQEQARIVNDRRDSRLAATAAAAASDKDNEAIDAFIKANPGTPAAAEMALNRLRLLAAKKSGMPYANTQDNQIKDKQAQIQGQISSQNAKMQEQQAQQLHMQNELQRMESQRRANMYFHN